MLEQSRFRFGFRVVGGRDQERRLTDFNAAFLAHLSNDDRAERDREVYLSSFLFSDDFREYLTTHGTTKGFTGPTWSSWLWFDIDREDDIDAAVTDARRLVRSLCDRWHIDADAALLLFFSGSKGFHVGLPTTLWNAQPAVIFHHYAKHFATCLAGLAEVEIDTGVYDRVSLFRAPNSRHQKPGRHKRRLTAEEFFGMTSAERASIATLTLDSRDQSFCGYASCDGHCRNTMQTPVLSSRENSRAPHGLSVTRRRFGWSTSDRLAETSS